MAAKRLEIGNALPLETKTPALNRTFVGGLPTLGNKFSARNETATWGTGEYAPGIDARELCLACCCWPARLLWYCFRLSDEITPGTVLPDTVSASLSQTVANVWIAVTNSAPSNFADGNFIKEYFRGLPSGVVMYLLNEIEKATSKEVDAAKMSVLSKYVAEKDRINLHYDSLQRDADETMKATSEVSERKLSAALSDARRKYRPLQETTTSLQDRLLSMCRLRGVSCMRKMSRQTGISSGLLRSLPRIYPRRSNSPTPTQSR